MLANDFEEKQVLLVDNGSREPCGEHLQSAFPTIELLVLPENQGFAGGAIRGIERAMEMGAEYIHLIGNDSTLAPNAITKLVEALDEHPEAGAAGPLLLSPGDDELVQFYRADVDRDRAWHTHYGHFVPLASKEWPTVENDFIPFVAMMFRRNALEEVGLMVSPCFLVFFR